MTGVHGSYWLPDGVIGSYVESDKVAEEGVGGWEVIDHISWTINSAFRFTRMEKKNVFMRSVFLSLD